jgi:hypothetical protein
MIILFYSTRILCIFRTKLLQLKTVLRKLFILFSTHDKNIMILSNNQCRTLSVLLTKYKKLQKNYTPQRRVETCGPSNFITREEVRLSRRNYQVPTTKAEFLIKKCLVFSLRCVWVQATFFYSLTPRCTAYNNFNFVLVYSVVC